MDLFQTAQELLSYISAATNNEHCMITIQLPGDRHPTLIQSIIWLEGQANYTRVHRQGGKSSMITQSLLWFERQLNFIRVHRSAIVNPLYIAEFWQKRGRAGWVRLTDGLVIPVSRSRLISTAEHLQRNGYAQRMSEPVSA